MSARSESMEMKSTLNGPAGSALRRRARASATVRDGSRRRRCAGVGMPASGGACALRTTRRERSEQAQLRARLLRVFEDAATLVARDLAVLAGRGRPCSSRSTHLFVIPLLALVALHLRDGGVPILLERLRNRGGHALETARAALDRRAVRVLLAVLVDLDPLRVERLVRAGAVAVALGDLRIDRRAGVDRRTGGRRRRSRGRVRRLRSAVADGVAVAAVDRSGFWSEPHAMRPRAMPTAAITPSPVFETFRFIAPADSHGHGAVHNALCRRMNTLCRQGLHTPDARVRAIRRAILGDSTKNSNGTNAGGFGQTCRSSSPSLAIVRYRCYGEGRARGRHERSGPSVDPERALRRFRPSSSRAPPRYRRWARWYGWQTLAADGAALHAGWVADVAYGETAEQRFAVASVATWVASLRPLDRTGDRAHARSSTTRRSATSAGLRLGATSHLGARWPRSRGS